MMSIDLLKIHVTDPKAQSVLQLIATSARRGADMVDQVLSFARGMEGRRIEIQVRHLVRDILTIAEETFPKSIRIKADLVPDLWTIEADPTQIHQVLLNLMVNSRDAMPDGGKITIRAENFMIDEQYASMNIESQPGPHVRIEVEDTGCGIPKSEVNKIFDPFFTTKQVGKGTGLGLSTALAIVRSHGGFIQVYSESSEGSRFRVYLPAMEGSELKQVRLAPNTQPRGHGETILLVDDEASILNITKQTLETFGYRVLLAPNGAEAVSVYVENRDQIDVVLTDMMMPLMDGPSLIRSLRRLNPTVKVIGASGMAAKGMVVESVQEGVKHFLPKPYTADTLLNMLRSVLDEDLRKN
jgi:CheY-like chemotaxis protein